MFDKFILSLGLVVMAAIAASFGESINFAIFMTGAIIILSGLGERDAR